MSLQIVPGASAPSAPPTAANPERMPLLRGLVQEPMHQYQERPALSRSVLERIALSPAHLRYFVEHGDEDSDALLLGRVLHLLVLEPELVADQVVVWQGDRRAGKAWEAFQLEHAGKEIVRAADMELAQAMAAKLRAHPTVAALEGGSIVEASALWNRDGIACKARPDIISGFALYDVKTSASARFDDFQRQAYNCGYHRQAAWYLDGVTAATGVPFKRFVFIVVEKDAPHEVAVFEASPEFVARGRAENDEHFALYRACTHANEWPGYPRAPQKLTLPRWVLS